MSLGDSSNSQKLFQMFYFERILERISKSKYSGQIILKGGLLLSSIIGVDERTTKDMDATLSGIPLTEEKIQEVFNNILNINLNDDVLFELISIKDIRLENEYGGFRLNILGKLGNNKTYIAVELTTGDVITPKEVEYTYQCIFENKKISIMSYTLETILAEKFQTIMSRGLLNTRMKDFYDIYILINTKLENINVITLILAIKNTFLKRNNVFNVDEFKLIVDELRCSTELNHQWFLYQSKNKYSISISYLDTLDAIERIINILE